MTKSKSIRLPLRCEPPDPGECPECGGDLMRSTYDPLDPYLYCPETDRCVWQGVDDYSLRVETLARVSDWIVEAM